MQGKPDNLRHERPSRQREESIVSMDRASNNGQIPFSDKMEAKSGTALKSRDDVQSNIGGTDQLRTSRNPVTTSAQGDDNSERRPRTPEGPRANVGVTRSDSPAQRNAAQRDPQSLRHLRYDGNRTANVNSPRSIQGFRAPPPTGPRSAAISGGLSTSANVNVSRQQPGRSVGAESQRTVSNVVPRPSAPATGKSEISSSSPTAPTILSDRGLPRSNSHRDNQSDSAILPPANESRRPHTTQSDSNSKPDNLPTNDSSRPSDWRGRQRRDIQDEDPRRLSRGPDSTTTEMDNIARPLRQADEPSRPALSKQSESMKEPLPSTSRVPRDKDEKDRHQSSRQTRDLRPENEKSEVEDGRRTRATVRAEPSEASGRSRGNQAANIQSERAKLSSGHDSKSTESGSTLEKNKSSTREQKESIPAERKEIPKEKAESISRESKETTSKEQRSSRGHRDDDGGRRREERDGSTRSQREDPRDSRNDRPRASHHGRRRSPSRTHSDRGDKKERDRESERRNGNHRDSREAEHRDKERSSRESEHRQDARDRDRSSREKEPENRRGSRKHDRDRSADAVDRGTRSGDGADSSGQVDSSNKRRRVVR